MKDPLSSEIIRYTEPVQALLPFFTAAGSMCKKCEFRSDFLNEYRRDRIDSMMRVFHDIGFYIIFLRQMLQSDTKTSAVSSRRHSPYCTISMAEV